jgi:L-aminoadipate-semialdehyde dehydrogenase
MVPVDHVARCTSLAALTPPEAGMQVAHVQASPLPTFNGMFRALEQHGFGTKQCEYLVWRRRLEQHVLETQDNALLPLLHFVLDDLPTSTKAPHLNDANTRVVLRAHALPEESTVDDDTMGKYLAWLVHAGFLPAPTSPAAVPLPVLGEGVATKAVGRSGS